MGLLLVSDRVSIPEKLQDVLIQNEETKLLKDEYEQLQASYGKM